MSCFSCSCYFELYIGMLVSRSTSHALVDNTLLTFARRKFLFKKVIDICFLKCKFSSFLPKSLDYSKKFGSETRKFGIKPIDRGQISTEKYIEVNDLRSQMFKFHLDTLYSESNPFHWLRNCLLTILKFNWFGD